MIAMRVVLFCQNSYAFSILEPLADAAVQRGWSVLWYVAPSLTDQIPATWEATVSFTTDLQAVQTFAPDAIMVPGNEVPYWLRGVKVQVFHGFAGEKKGHFRVRGYFDLYLTQGPYFTERFQALAEKHGDFSVVETGWPRVDRLFDEHVDRAAIRQRYGVEADKPILLYAPTFSPKLTSVPDLLPEIPALLDRTGGHLLIKFHPLMDQDWVGQYRRSLADASSVSILEDNDVTPALLVSDLLISDTSSVVYEFALLGRPIVTIRSTAPEHYWTDVKRAADVPNSCVKLLSAGPADGSNTILSRYHPYTDGRSAERMLDAVSDYIYHHGVPDHRSIGFLRRHKIHRLFGRVS